jgi:hypothetical protein
MVGQEPLKLSILVRFQVQQLDDWYNIKMIEGSPKYPNNYTPSSEEKEAIDQKTRELYEKRIARYADDLTESQKETILNFQKVIFTLDHYFEHNEKVDKDSLDPFWKQLEQSLDDLGVPQDLQKQLLQDIRDYAEIEASIRDGKRLADYDIALFYLKKSCDVRLQRHLIRYLIHHSPESSSEEIVTDQLEEIEDDVDDIEEDKATPFNGNRLLEILLSGDTYKLNEYFAFINSQSSAPEELTKRVVAKIKEALDNGQHS